jgi:hypothetical protein
MAAIAPAVAAVLIGAFGIPYRAAANEGSGHRPGFCVAKSFLDPDYLQ